MASEIRESMFQRMLARKRRFYSECLILGALASEVARQLTSFSG